MTTIVVVRDTPNDCHKKRRGAECMDQELDIFHSRAMNLSEKRY